MAYSYSPLVFARAQFFVLWAHQCSPCSHGIFQWKGAWFVVVFVSLAIPRFGLLYLLSPFRFSSGHSRPVLTLRTNNAAHASLPSPQSLLVDVSGWTTSLLIVAVRHIFCAFFSVMLPSEISKHPTDTPMRGFPIVWKLLLHDSLPRTGLRP